MYIVAENDGILMVRETLSYSVGEAWNKFKAQFMTADDMDYNLKIEESFSVFEVEITLGKKVQA